MINATARDLITHLRFPFSLFLLPVFLFAWAHAGASLEQAWPLLLILHLLVYPSSNGFNSFMDRDEGSIGGIEQPTPVPTQMRWLSVMMDVAALLGCYLAYDFTTTCMLCAYILASRLYSHRSIRIKRLPIVGFIWVVIFQGAFVFALVLRAFDEITWQATTVVAAFICSSIIAASYPLTQIYQHHQDLKDGVKTFSWWLGIRGTMVWSICTFAVFNIAVLIYLWLSDRTLWLMVPLLVATAPAGMHLASWTQKVWRSPSEASYRMAMKMSVMGSVGLNLFFAFLLIYDRL